jgi:hypothetical protein
VATSYLLPPWSIEKIRFSILFQRNTRQLDVELLSK